MEEKKKRGRSRKNQIPESTEVHTTDDGIFRVSLNFNEQEYSAEGKTVVEAFDNFDNSKFSIFMKGVILKTQASITVESGEQKKTQLLTGWQTKRFMVSPIFRRLLAKRFI